MGQPMWGGHGSWGFPVLHSRTGKGLWLEGGNPFLDTPDLSPTPDQAHWEDYMCVCQLKSLGPARIVEITLTHASGISVYLTTK